MFPRTASERFRVKVSRSFFTTFSLGKKPCVTQPLSWIQSHVRVLSIGTSCRTDASLQGIRSHRISASAASTFFPGHAHWMTKPRALFDQWLKRHRLPATLHPMFQEFCEEQWHQHVTMLEQSPRLNWAMLQKVKSTLHKDLVLYNEDRHPNHIVCFCPRFFFVGFATHGMIRLYFRAWRARQTHGGRKCCKKSQHTFPDGIPGVSANQPRCQEAQFF